VGVLLLVAGAALALWLGERFAAPARLIAIPALLLCAYAGLTLPDIDQPLPLDHRSALTHSIGPALLALVRRWARPVAAGLALGLGLHLAADLFPNAMVGFATIKVPFAGSIGADLSYAWIGVNGIACLLLGGRLTRDVSHRTVAPLLLAAVALLGLWYLFQVDGGWPALVMFGLAGWLGLRWRRTRL